MLQFWKSIALEKRSSVQPKPWTEKGKQNFSEYFFFSREKLLLFRNKHVRVEQKKWPHIFLLLLLCISLLVKMSRAESTSSRSDFFVFCVFYAKCKIDFWKVLHSISQMLNYTALHSGAKSPKSDIFQDDFSADFFLIFCWKYDIVENFLYFTYFQLKINWF